MVINEPQFSFWMNHKTINLLINAPSASSLLVGDYRLLSSTKFFIEFIVFSISKINFNKKFKPEYKTLKSKQKRHLIYQFQTIVFPFIYGRDSVYHPSRCRLVQQIMIEKLLHPYT